MPLQPAPNRLPPCLSLFTLTLAAFTVPALAQTGTPQLFRVVGAKDEVAIGIAASEFAALGSAPGVERLA